MVLIIAKWVKCQACRKLFTQTIVKKKRSIPVCPYCKKVNHDTRV